MKKYKRYLKLQKGKPFLRYLNLTLTFVIIVIGIYYGVELLKRYPSFKDILKVVIVYLGIVDGWKYLRQKQKIVRMKSSKDISRLFSLSAFICDIGFVTYTILIKEPVLIFVRVFALYTTLDLYYHCYVYYPYKDRFKRNFKRPSLVKFVVNTLMPNNSRSHL